MSDVSKYRKLPRRSTNIRIIGLSSRLMIIPCPTNDLRFFGSSSPFSSFFPHATRGNRWSESILRRFFPDGTIQIRRDGSRTILRFRLVVDEENTKRRPQWMEPWRRYREDIYRDRGEAGFGYTRGIKEEGTAWEARKIFAPIYGDWSNDSNNGRQVFWKMARRERCPLPRRPSSIRVGRMKNVWTYVSSSLSDHHPPSPFSLPLRNTHTHTHRFLSALA